MEWRGVGVGVLDLGFALSWECLIYFLSVKVGQGGGRRRKEGR